jgi:hypothetical protein
MATYYVTSTGNAANSGLTTSAPWTLAKAFLSAVAGDIVYIAPGVYRGAFTLSNSGTSGSPIQFIGDPLATVGWVGISAGQVRVTNISDDTTGTAAGATLINGVGRTWISFNKIAFECIRTSTIQAFLINVGWSITQCQIVAIATNSVCQTIGGTNTTGGTDMNFTFTRNVLVTNGSGLYMALVRHTSAYGVTVNVKNCIFLGHNTAGESFGIRVYGTGSGSEGGGYTLQNNTIVGFTNATSFDIGNTTYKHSVTNSAYIGSVTALQSVLGTTVVTEDYNRILAQTARNGFPTGANTSVNGSVGVEYGYNEIVGLPSTQMISSILGSPNTGFGTATNALATDLYSIAWTGATPDAGASTYANISTLGYYAPTERNASTITIAPGSTSQSIELYLGVIGLTASTAGLSARYNRTRTASVSIPLVARTIAQAWTAGGFAEVDATNMPGVYRLDVPDAALAAGADDVTIVVRGASGTNGAVMTVKLSSGGLTEAQTASAVWDALSASYTSAGSMGARVLQTTVDNRPAEVGASNHIHANVHAIVDNTSAATELRGALLHNGTDYISADLLTPVSAATSVHIGPYQLLADGLGADQPLDVNVGTATSIDVQVTDANGTGIDITGATTSVKVYNAGGTLVATYSGTATYADNGRLSFGLTTTVTNTSGTYTVTVTRTTGATDTQVFGPLKLYVRPV